VISTSQVAAGLALGAAEPLALALALATWLADPGVALVGAAEAELDAAGWGLLVAEESQPPTSASPRASATERAV